MNPNTKSEFLYPHTDVCFVILVPHSKKQTLIRMLVASKSIRIICVTICLFGCLRILISRSSINKWIGLFLQTIGVYLSQYGIRRVHGIQNKIWAFSLVYYAIITTAIVSGILYSHLTKTAYEPNIDSLKDLIASDLNIWIPETVRLGDISDEVKLRLHYGNTNNLGGMFTTDSTQKNAYIFPRITAELYQLLRLTIYKTADKGSPHPYYIMKQPLCRY